MTPRQKLNQACGNYNRAILNSSKDRRVTYWRNEYNRQVKRWSKSLQSAWVKHCEEWEYKFNET